MESRFSTAFFPGLPRGHEDDPREFQDSAREFKSILEKVRSATPRYPYGYPRSRWPTPKPRSRHGPGGDFKNNGKCSLPCLSSCSKPCRRRVADYAGCSPAALLGLLAASSGSAWGRLRAFLGRLGAILGGSWAVLERSWGPLGRSWSVGKPKRREGQKH